MPPEHFDPFDFDSFEEFAAHWESDDTLETDWEDQYQHDLELADENFGYPERAYGA